MQLMIRRVRDEERYRDAADRPAHDGAAGADGILIDIVQADATRSATGVQRDTALARRRPGIDNYLSKLVDDNQYYLHDVAAGESTRKTGATTVSELVQLDADAGDLDRRGDLDVPERQGRLVPARQRLRVQPADHRRVGDLAGRRHRVDGPQDRLDEQLPDPRGAGAAVVGRRLPDARERRHQLRLDGDDLREDLRRHRLERRTSTTSTTRAPPTATCTPRARSRASRTWWARAHSSTRRRARSNIRSVIKQPDQLRELHDRAHRHPARRAAERHLPQQLRCRRVASRVQRQRHRHGRVVHEIRLERDRGRDADLQRVHASRAARSGVCNVPTNGAIYAPAERHRLRWHVDVRQSR